MCPELHIRIWMSSKRNASMTIGISMGQEICLIIGQVSLNFCNWKKNLQTGICGLGDRFTRKQLTSKPDHLWPKLWKSMGKHAKLKEKQKWSNEKLHLENARKHARKNLEKPVAPVMPCKIMKKNCGNGASNKIKTRLACILEASESTRLRMGESLPNHHEDHITGKGDRWTCVI